MFIPPPHTSPSYLPLRSAHSRVLWGVAWSPDDRLLATGSRDETVKVWEVSQVQHEGTAPLSVAVVSERPVGVLPPFSSAVTALAFAPMMGKAAGEAAALPPGGVLSHTELLAVGLEDGTLQIWAPAVSASPPTSTDCSDLIKGLRCVWSTDPFTRFSAAVSSVCWRVVGEEEVDEEEKKIQGIGAQGKGMLLQIGASGRDHSVRVFNVRV